MKIKLITQSILICFLVCCALSCRREDRDGGGRGAVSVTAESLLDGETLGETLAKFAYLESGGDALVEGVQFHYYLYNTYGILGGEGSALFKYIFEWIERHGGVIDYDNVEYYSPNTGLANSVKALMSSRGADVSVTIYRRSNNRRRTFLTINNYVADDDYYETYVYPVVGFRWR